MFLACLAVAFGVSSAWYFGSAPPSFETELTLGTSAGFETAVGDEVARRLEANGVAARVTDVGSAGRVTLVTDMLDGTYGLLEGVLKEGRFGLHLVVDGRLDRCPASPPAGQTCLRSSRDQTAYLVGTPAVFDNSDIVDALQQIDRNGYPAVQFRLGVGATRTFCTLSSGSIGKQIALVVDGDVLSAPVVRSGICGGSGQITGDFSLEDAGILASKLSGEPLAAPVTIEALHLLESQRHSVRARVRARHRDFARR